jgi:hypothetical protein
MNPDLETLFVSRLYKGFDITHNHFHTLNQQRQFLTMIAILQQY